MVARRPVVHRQLGTYRKLILTVEQSYDYCDMQKCLGGSSNSKRVLVKAQSKPTPLQWPHNTTPFHRGPLARHAKDTIQVEEHKRETMVCLLRCGSSGRHRSSLAGGLLGDRSCGCGLAFADVALGGGDGVAALLCPRRLLGPLRILPCFT